MCGERKKEYAAHISKAAMETGKAKRTHKSVHCTQKMERSEKKNHTAFIRNNFKQSVAGRFSASFLCISI